MAVTDGIVQLSVPLSSIIPVPAVITKDGLNLDPKVIVNQSIILNCPVEGKPSPSITWYKNGLQLGVTVQVGGGHFCSAIILPPILLLLAISCNSIFIKCCSAQLVVTRTV